MNDAFANKQDNLSIIGVDTAENLGKLLTTNKTIIAGIQFNHVDNTVSKINIIKTHENYENIFSV